MVVVGQAGKYSQGLQTLDHVSHGHLLQGGRGGGQVSSHRFWDGGSRSRLDLGQQPWFTLYVVIIGQAGKDPLGMYTLDCVIHGHRLQKGCGGGQVSSCRFWDGESRSILDIGQKPWFNLCLIFSISNVFGKNLLKAFIGVGRRRAVGAGEEE